MTDELLECEACLGHGEWEVECCNGSGGCSCQGQTVYMGKCLVCHGTGMRSPNADVAANRKSITGYCFIGTGPTSGIWAGKPAMGKKP